MWCIDDFFIPVEEDDAERVLEHFSNMVLQTHNPYFVLAAILICAEHKIDLPAVFAMHFGKTALILMNEPLEGRELQKTLRLDKQMKRRKQFMDVCDPFA